MVGSGDGRVGGGRSDEDRSKYDVRCFLLNNARGTEEEQRWYRRRKQEKAGHASPGKHVASTKGGDRGR